MIAVHYNPSSLILPLSIHVHDFFSPLTVIFPVILESFLLISISSTLLDSYCVNELFNSVYYSLFYIAITRDADFLP